MVPTEKLRGYVIAVHQDAGFASVYFKESPTLELVLDLDPDFVNTLKVGNEIEFDYPNSFQENLSYPPQLLGVQLYDECRKTIMPENPTAFSQIEFVTKAIFTTDEDDDAALLEPDVFAVGFSEHFGRFVVTSDFEDTSVTFEKGKLYRVHIRRYPKKSKITRFERWGTVLICSKVASVGGNEEYRLINLLQEKCPWSQNLEPIKPPTKTPINKDAQTVKSRMVPRSGPAKEMFFEDSSALLIPFGLIVERFEQYTSVFSPAHHSFYRVSSVFTNLEPGSICSLKLCNEEDGVFQKCSINQVFLNMPASVRLIASGIIEAVFDVELCQMSDNLFPTPWATVYGDSKHLGKVLIPENDNLPPIGTIINIRAIFLNKPVRDFCWIITDVLKEADVVASKITTQKPCVSFDKQPNESNSSSLPKEQSTPEPKNNDVSRNSADKIAVFDESVILDKIESPKLNVGVSARSVRNYNYRNRSHSSGSESDVSLPEGDARLTKRGSNQFLESDDANVHNDNVNVSTSDLNDSDGTPAKIGFGDGCVKDDFDTGNETSADREEKANEQNGLPNLEKANDENICLPEIAAISKSHNTSHGSKTEDEESIDSDNQVVMGIGEEDGISDANVLPEVYNQFKTDDEDSDGDVGEPGPSTNTLREVGRDDRSDLQHSDFEENNANVLSQLRAHPNWKHCVADSEESEQDEDKVSVSGDSNNSLMIDNLDEHNGEPANIDQHNAISGRDEDKVSASGNSNVMIDNVAEHNDKPANIDQHNTANEQQQSTSCKFDDSSDDSDYDHGFVTRPKKSTKNNMVYTQDSQSSVCSTDEDD